MNSKYFQIILWSLCMVIFHTTSHAQFTETYFSEENSEYSNIFHSFNDDTGIYYFGHNLHEDNLKWFVRKLDYDGNVIWSLYDPILNEDYTSSLRNAFLSKDGYIYAVEFGKDYAGEDDYYLNLLKIDPLNGQILYEQLLATDNHLSNTLELNNVQLGDLTPEKLFMKYESSEYVVVDKATGNVDATGDLNHYQYSNSSTYHAFVSDSTHLFVAHNDTLAKKSWNDLDNDIWSLKISPFDVGVNFIAYDNDTDDLYYFVDGGSTQPLIYKIDKANGGVYWSVELQAGSIYSQHIEDYIIKENHITIILRHGTLSNDDFRLKVVRMDKHTGDIIWEHDNLLFSSNTSSSIHVNDVILDDNDDVYVTGYQGIENQNLVKLNGQNGAVIWRNVYDSENNEGGNDAFVHMTPQGNLLTIADNANEGSLNYTEHLRILNPLNGDEISYRNLGGYSKLSSRILDLRVLPNDDYIIAYRSGNELSMMRKDAFGNTIWEVKPPVNRIIEDLKMEIANDTAYLFMGTTTNFEPQYQRSSDLSIMKMNIADGTMMNRLTSIYVSSDTGLDYMTKNTLYIPSINRLFALMTTDDDDFLMKVSTYHPPNGGPGNMSGHDIATTSSSGISAFLDLPEETTPVLMHQAPNSDSIFVVYRNAVSVFHPGGEPNFTYHGGNVFYGSNPSLVSKSSLSLANGKILIGGNGSWSFPDGILKTYNPYTYEIEGGWTYYGGEIIAMEPDINPDEAYILSSKTDSTVIRKINVNTGAVVWETLAFEKENNTILIPYHMLYNPVIDKLAIIGQLKDEMTDETRVFIQILDGNGTVLRQIIRQGTSPLGNYCNKVDYLPSTGDFLFGGAITREYEESDAFVFGMRGDALEGSFVDGLVFRDVNGNGIRDVEDYNVQIGKINKNDETIYMHTDGTFTEVLTENETHVFTYEPEENWQLVTTPASYTMITPVISDTLLVFGIDAINPETALEVYMVSEPVICNEDSRLSVMVKNVGTEIVDGQLVLDYASPYTFMMSSVAPDSTSGSQLHYELDSIYPGSTTYIHIDFNNPNQEYVGVVFPYYAMVDFESGGQMNSSDFTLNELLLCSYDPNDKQVVPAGLGNEGYTLIGEKLHYTIRFQNTGNYPARDVVITDEIDMDLDLETFQLIGASHQLTNVKQEGRWLTFEFIDINLPDSVNNEPASHGYVMFTLEHNSDIDDYTLVENTANIYFDLNPAIVTNTTNSLMVIEFPTTSLDEWETDVNVEIAPNPNNGQFNMHINSDNFITGNYTVHIFDVQGRKMKEYRLDEFQSTNTFRLSIEQKGVFWLELFDDNNVSITREKIIVH